MLGALSVRNVVLIKALDLELKSGFTVMTGETGAGKSIVLDALGMATGARSDRNLVRKGADKARCTATFFLPASHAVWSKITDAELDIEPGEHLVLRRIVNADGRSRAFINDQPVSARLLATVGECVLEVHGQHDERGLLDSSTHRTLLDQFGGHGKELAVCTHTFLQMQLAAKHLSDLKSRHERAIEDREFLEHAIHELNQLAATSGEDRELAERRRILQYAEGALNQLATASRALGEDSEYETCLAQALSGLENIRGKIVSGAESEDPTAQALVEASKAIERALIELQDARGAVDNAAQAFTFEPNSLEQIEERLFALRAMARKYDVRVDELPAKRQSFGEELLALQTLDTELFTAEAALGKARKDFEQAAIVLGKVRTKTALRLDKCVQNELPALKMQATRFETMLTETEPTRYGRDQIRFQVATNPGSTPGPLTKIASGGELSRFSLAIKVALAGDTDSTLVFDEIDQGVGGAVADAVGKRLSRLSKRAQVLVVTHSPQVAASADHQVLIGKTSVGKGTFTSVEILERDEREEEIARMLAGESITDAARAAARQLMKAG